MQNFSPLLVLLLVGACASTPIGPSVMVLPGTSKSFDQFRGDDMECRHYAYEQTGGANADACMPKGIAYLCRAGLRPILSTHAK